MDDICETCQKAPHRCSCPADGYECQKCGHQPTYSELQNGLCPHCDHKPHTPKK